MSGRVLEFFEIKLPVCANTYGVAPCEAELGVTGDAKCFNCLSTCQDTDNFSDDTATIRFAKPASYLPRDIDIVGPWIRSIDFTPATISLAENLGTRAVLKVILEDHRHSDAGEGLDKYQADRGYDPYERGSFWPRFAARYPSLDGVECVWIIGEVGQSLAEMEHRSFYIEGGPSGDGTITITAKDALKFLDGAKAQIPVLSGGFLVSGIDADDASFTLSPSGIGNDEYPAGGTDYLCIAGKEIVQYSRSGDVVTISQRGALGTTASSHAAGDRVQVVRRFAAMAAADIIASAIDDYSDLPADYIPLAEWQLEDSTNLGTLYTFTLSEPMAVSAFVGRVLEQCGSMMWDDALARKLRFKVIKAVPTSAEIISEANVVNNTFEMTGQPDQRVSRAWVYYGISDPTKRRDELNNYRQAVRRPDEEAALASEALYGAPEVRKIMADGIAIGGGSVAQRVGNLVLGRKQRPPRRFKWSMLRGGDLPVLGGGYYLDWRSLQDASGLRDPVPVQIISARVAAAIFQFTAEEMRFTDLDTGSLADRVLLIDFNTNNINLRAIHDQIYPSTFDGVTVTFIISSTIGSTSTNVPALTVGDWPVGFVPAVVVSGRVQGRGGNGGGGADFLIGSNGAGGGPAFYTRHAITLNTSSGGAIWGGGGGGGGGGGANPVLARGGAGGGGGGASQPDSPGGYGGSGYFGLGAPGASGTALAGGAGGPHDTGTPGYYNQPGDGGAGGGPGLPGNAGTKNGTGVAGSGGAAGAAIDGISYIALTLGAGDIRGSQIN